MGKRTTSLVLDVTIEQTCSDAILKEINTAVYIAIAPPINGITYLACSSLPLKFSDERV